MPVGRRAFLCGLAATPLGCGDDMRFGFRTGLGNVAPPSVAVSDSIVILQRFVADAVGQTAGAGEDYEVTDEGDCVLWLDLQDAASLTIVGSTITAIKNKISNTTWSASSSCPY